MNTFTVDTDEYYPVCYKVNDVKTFKNGQVDSPELPETPEVTEMTENFMKVTKYLTKFKETLINYVWEKSHVKKQEE